MMLKNGTFEADWGTQASHDVLICKPGQAPYLSILDNVFTPPNWLTWFWHRPGDSSDPETYDQPEVRDAWRQHDARRVRSGEKAILFFTFYRRHRGGFLQQVNVEAGKRLRFTAWAHAWSNHDGDQADFPHPDDGRWSEGAGYNEIAWAEGTQPHDTGDKQQDARANFTFAVGIDPTGGTDPMADSVVWGDAFHIYNGYCKQLSVEAIAQADTVTVFLFSEVLWAFKHGDAYFDDAELSYVDGPTPGGCRAPRTDYPRSYVLLPPSHGIEWWQAAVAGGFQNRYTIGGSADDAGLGVDCLTHRKVLAVNPDAWGDDLQGFFDTYYPGVEYTPLDAATPSMLETLLKGDQPGWEQYLLWQCNPAWREARFGPAQCLMCEYGCYVANLAMAQLIKGIDPQATPLTVASILEGGGYAASTCCPLWSEVEERCNIAICGGTTAQAEAHLAAGGVAMIEVLPAGREHFVLAVESLGDGDYVILDPYRNEVAKLRDHYSGVESWRILVVGEEPIPPPPPPPPSGPKLGPHVLRSAGKLGEYAPRAAITKWVGDWGSAEGKLVIGRLVSNYDAQAQRNSGKNPLQAASQFVGDQLSTYQSNPHIKCWEGHNEPVWGSSEEMAWYAQFEIERMKLMADLGLKCVIGNFATGTPPLNLWPAFLPAIGEAAQHGAILGLHEYSCPWTWWMTGKYQLDPDEDEGDEGWTTLRYRKVYHKYLEPAGLGDTPLVITECGLDPLVNPKPPGCDGGTWKQLHSYWAAHQDGEVAYTSDDAEYYFRQLEWYDEELQKDDYVLGAAIFCWGNFGPPWSDYDVANTAVEDKLIAYAGGEDPPPQPPSSLAVGLHDQGGGDWMLNNWQ